MERRGGRVDTQITDEEIEMQMRKPAGRTGSRRRMLFTSINTFMTINPKSCINLGSLLSR